MVLSETQTCVFCRIVRGEEAASVVLDDGPVLAFMALHQRNPGHVLVIPKAHVPTIYEFDETLAGPLFGAVVRIARAVKTAFRPDGITVRQNNERAGGQEVFHLHVHVIPRRTGDVATPGRPPQPAPVAYDERLRQAEQLRRALDGSLGS